MSTWPFIHPSLCFLKFIKYQLNQSVVFLIIACSAGIQRGGGKLEARSAIKEKGGNGGTLQSGRLQCCG